MRLIWLLPILAVGCEPKEKMTGPPVKVGEIGSATFVYGCGPDSDVQCNMDAELAPKAMNTVFPQVAVGSKFAITTVTNVEAGTGAPLGVGTAGTVMVDVDPMSKLLLGKKEGYGALLALSGTTVVDITSIHLAVPTKLEILQGTPDGKFLGGSVSIGPGGVSATSSVVYTFRFRAIPKDDSGGILAGALPCNWTTSDANVAKITTPPQQNIVTVVSGTAGTANIDVTLGPLKGQIVIKVN